MQTTAVAVILIALLGAVDSQCRDLHPHCDLFTALDVCNNTAQAGIVKYNCAKSCGLCGKSTGACADRLADCGAYQRQELCAKDDPLRAEFACAKTCNFCNTPV